MNKKILTAVTTIVSSLAIVASPNLFAHEHRHSHKKERYIEYARVVHVDPIYHTVRVVVPTERCWQERPRSYQEQRVVYRAPENALLGGLIGGAIGHELANDHNKGVATIAGAIIGSAVASQGNVEYYHTGEDRSEPRQHCKTRNHYRTEQQLMGYRVSYRYHGHTYTTRMKHRPGKRIAVKVNATPARHLY